MPRIAISYRRTDSAGTTGRIHEKLAAHFGEDDVFIDLFKIPPAIDFRQHIRETISNSEVVLAIIGRHWVDGENRQRLNDPTDLVRIEIQTALEKLIPIIPVRVDEAVMPAAGILPQEIRELVYRNGSVVSPTRDFHIHMGSLIQSIEQILKTRDSQRAAAISAASNSADESQRGVVTIDQLLHGPAFGLSKAPSNATANVAAGVGSDKRDDARGLPRGEGSPRDPVRVLETEPVSLIASSSDGERLARDDHDAPSRSQLDDRHPRGGDGEDDRYRVALPSGDYEGDSYYAEDGHLPPPDKIGPPAVRRRGSVMAIAVFFGVLIIGGAGVIGYRAFISGAGSTTSPSPTASQTPPAKTESQAAIENPAGKPFQDRLNLSDPSNSSVVPADQSVAPPRIVRQSPIAVPAGTPSSAPPASPSEPRRVRTLSIRPDGPDDAVTAGRDTPLSRVYVVQVSAQRTEAEAISSYRALQQKYPSVLGAREANYRRVDLGDKGGVFYRASIGSFGTPEEATAFCDNLKSAGGQCIVQRN
jgi:hypothetical protein